MEEQMFNELKKACLSVLGKYKDSPWDYYEDIMKKKLIMWMV